MLGMVCFPKKPLYAHHLPNLRVLRLHPPKSLVRVVYRSIPFAVSRNPVSRTGRQVATRWISLLVKIFATALTFSQVTVGPDTIKTEFDPVQDQHEVVAAAARRLRPHAQGVRHRGHQYRRPDRDRDGRSGGGLRRAAAVPRHEPRRPAHRLPAVLQERDGREFAGRHRRRHRVLQPRGREPARPHAAARPAAARRQRGARRPRPEIRGGVRAGPAAGLGSARRDSGARPQGVHRRRGQALPRSTAASTSAR